MKKYLKRTLLLIVLIPFLFLTYEIIRSRIIFESTRMKSISIDTVLYSNILSDFYSGPVIFNDTYLIEKKDTLISFEINEKSGLLWIISDLPHIGDSISFVRKERMKEREDGSFNNYTISKKPVIMVSYYKGYADPTGQCNFIYSSRLREQFLFSKDNIMVKKVVLDSSLELRNRRNILSYRVDCGMDTELYTYYKDGSTYCIFFQ